jgi:hypothetical protein
MEVYAGVDSSDGIDDGIDMTVDSIVGSTDGVGVVLEETEDGNEVGREFGAIVDVGSGAGES